MSGARNAILQRVRAALHDVPADENPQNIAVNRTYRIGTDLPRAELVAQFAERVREYKAHVTHVNVAELPQAIKAACAARGVQRLVAPPDIPQQWLPPEVETLLDDGLSYAQLDQSDGVLTGCAWGIAQTGTIILDGGVGQGRRVISLLPDYHLCVVHTDQIVGLVPEAITGLGDAVRGGQPITFISGPSATSDIELNRVEGVHGPRTLEVLIVRSGGGME